MRKILIVLFIIFSLFPIGKIYAENSNVGFVPANIWYSEDPFQEGDTIKIYTLIFNPDSKELSGSVIFLDNDVLLGKQDFIAPANGVKEVHITWTVTVGNHTIYGKIENAKLLISKGKYQDIYLTENETQKSSRTVAKKIVPTTNELDVKLETNNNDNSTPGLVENISNTIKEKTPAFISQPLISASNTVEKIRENFDVSSLNTKEKLQNEIKILDNNKISDKKTNNNVILKPFKYMEIFFLTLFNFVLKNKFLFYGISIVIIFLLLRLIWRKIF